MLTSGFYNSKDHDRRYDADQFGAVFDGIIHDGIFFNVGNRFMPRLGEGNKIIIGSGRAWFIHCWVLNTTDYVVTLPAREVADRIDTIVIEINKTEAVRAATIKVIKGVAGPNPKPATLQQDDQIGQYPLCRVTVRSSGGIGVRDLEILVGQTPCPFVTGAVSSMSIDSLIARWEQEWSDEMRKWDEQMADQKAGYEDQMLQQNRDWTVQMGNQKEIFEESKQSWDNKMGDWTNQMNQQKTDWEAQTEEQRDTFTDQMNQQKTDWEAQTEEQRDTFTDQMNSQKGTFDQSLADQNATWTTQLTNQQTQFGIQMGTQQNEFSQLKEELEGVSKGLTEYLVCETAGDVPEKVVECEGFVLKQGVKVIVKFLNRNTASEMTLKIGNTAPGVIIYRGAPAKSLFPPSNGIVAFEYIAPNWEVIGEHANTWKANTKTSEGYVSKGEGNEGKVWAVDGNGNPEWSDTINGRISFHKGTSVFASNNNGDFDSGFLKLATFTWKHVSTGYRIPISMKLTKRYGYTPIDISIYFFSNAKESGNTPKLNAWSFDETKTTIYLVSTDNEGLVWELYVNAYPNLNNNFVEICELHVEEQTARYLDVELHQNAHVTEIPESELKAVAEVKNYSKIEAESSDIVKLTKEEYDALPDTKLTDGKIYFISGSGESGGTSQIIQAGNVIYDNSGSGLSAENVQDAIDEIAVEKFDKNGGILNGHVTITDLSNLTFYNPNGLNTGGVTWTDSKRTIWAAIKADNGTFYIKDDTNNTPILESNSNGTATFHCGNKAELRTDSEGGNLRLTGPSATQFWEMDSWNDTQFRIYHHNHETDQDTFPFTLWQDHIEGMTSGNVPFYKITAENINNPPSPYWNGNYAIGMGVINNIGYLSFKLGWIFIQFHLGYNQIMVRMCYGENGWVDWKTLVLW